jgi:sugar (pentulose or hexulose) kinase
MGTAVFDIGKTNLKLVLLDAAGRALAQRSRANTPLPGPPWLHPDLAGIEAWLLRSLAELAALHPIEAFVATAHGSGAVLVDEAGPVLPAIDYEQEVPAAVAERYARIVPPFPERGAPVQDGAVHFGRQLLWMEHAFPDAVARASWLLPLPQYWAWRLTGVAALEPSMLGAQSHLWSPLDGCLTPMVEAMGWTRLLPPIGPPSRVLGTPRPELGLAAAMQVLAGIHDSTANLYRYQAAGLADIALLSTGTWLVGMCPATQADALDETRSMTVTSDVAGRPVGGVLAMTGREYEALTGGTGSRATPEALTAIIRQGVLALPGFVAFDGIFPGSAGRGRIEGGALDCDGRIALATLYAALTADLCLDLLRSRERVVIDGGFTADPAFAGLVAALRPGQEVLVNADGSGTAQGAALLWTHANRHLPAQLDLAPPLPLTLPHHPP